MAGRSHHPKTKKGGTEMEIIALALIPIAICTILLFVNELRRAKWRA